MALPQKNFKVSMALSKTDLLKKYIDEASASYPTFNQDYRLIAAYFGYSFQSGSSTSKEVGDFLYAEIKKNLMDKNGDFPYTFFKKIRTQLVFEEYAYKLDISTYYGVSEIIKDATRVEALKSIHDDLAWIKCCEMALAKIELGYNPNLHRVTTEESNFSKAAKFFIDMKIRAKPVDGVLDTSGKEFYKVLDGIEYRAKLLGFKGIEFFNREISGLYDHNNERFMTKRNVHTYLADREAGVPYGYVLNIIGKYQSSIPRKNEDLKKRWEELKAITTNLVSLYEIEPYTPYSTMFTTNKNVIDVLQRSILFDNIFLFKQLPFWAMKYYLSSIFVFDKKISENIEKIIGISPEDINGFYLAIEKTIKDLKTFALNIELNSFHNMHPVISKEKLKILLDIFSTTDKDINKHYKSPLDYIHSTIDNYPLIRSKDNTFLIINIAVFSAQFYERYADILRSYDKKSDKEFMVDIDSTIGNNMELLFKEKLIESGIKFYHGKKYKINSDMRRYLSVKREESECDFVIETKNKILFLEFKKKTLTRRSSSGHIEDILYDIALAFFSAQQQIGVHEVILRKNGSIKFTTGEILSLNGRSVERISVSLFDFHALQDQQIIDNLFYSLIGSKVNYSGPESDGKDKIEKLQSYIDALTNQYSVDSMELYRSKNRPYANIRYFSIPQLLTLLKNCNNNEDFERELDVTRNASNGSMNWYFQYHIFRNNKKVSEATTAISKLNDAMMQV